MTKRFSFHVSRCYQVSGGLIVLLCIIMRGPASVHAAQVSGKLVAYEGELQQGGRHLHFQNEVTGDCYMVPTAADGGFGAQLPPGAYDLRAERGAILARAIAVGAIDIPLGQVSELAPYAPSRLWNLQSIAPSQIVSPAPSTANIMTADTTVPHGGRVVAAPVPDLPRTTPDRGAPAAAQAPPTGYP